MAALAYVVAAGSAAGGAWLAAREAPRAARVPAAGLGGASGVGASRVAAEGGDGASPSFWPDAPTPFGMGGGGAMFQPAVSPHDDRVIFVQCDMGGVYRSTDGGRAWRLLDTGEIRAAVCEGCPTAAFTFHPRRPATIYAFGERAGRGALLVSDDMGDRWAELAPGAPWGDAQVTALAFDATAPSRVFAGTTRGAFRSEDGGAAWVRVAEVRDDEVIAVAGESARWFLVTRARVLRSEDGGRRWDDASAGLPRGPLRAFALAGQPAGRATLWITAPSSVEGERLGGGVFASTDGGRSWRSVMQDGLNATTRRVDEHGLDDLPEYAFLGAARAAADVAWVTTRGNGLWPPHDFGVWRAAGAGDGAAPWREVLFGDPELPARRGLPTNVEAGWLTWDYGWSWGGHAYGFAAAPHDASRAIYTNLGEVLETRDGGGTWRQLYTDPWPAGAPAAGLAWRSRGLDVTSSFHVYEDPHTEGRVFVAHADIGLTVSDDGGRSWRHAVRGARWSNSVYGLAFDPAVRGRVWAAASAQHDIPHWSELRADAAKRSGGVLFTDDGGASWVARAEGLPDAPATAIALDPASPERGRALFVAVFGHGVYRSDDGGLAWRAASRGLPPRAHVSDLVRHVGGALFAVVTGARGPDGLAPGSGVWRSDDGAATWRAVGAGVPPYWITSIAVDPRDPERAWTTACDAPGRGATGEGGVFATEDGGATWRRLPLPRPPDGVALEVMAVTLDPTDTSTLWVGTNGHGTWESRDRGATFHALALPFRSTHRVERLRQDDEAVMITTFGGGTWRVPHRR